MPTTQSLTLLFKHALNRSKKRWQLFLLTVIVDMVAVGASMMLAALLSHNPLNQILPLVPLAAVLVVMGMFFGNFYLISARYLSLGDLLRMSIVAGVATVAIATLSFAINAQNRSSFAFDALFFFILLSSLAGIRVLSRMKSWNRKLNTTSRVRILIVGAGDAGETLIRDLRRSRAQVYDVLGLLDDDSNKWGMRIDGVRVITGISELPKVVAALGVQEVIVAIPTLEGSGMRHILDLCRTARVRVRTLPSVAQLANPGALTTLVREVEVEDLLRRKVVKQEIQEIAGYLADERVLITGAGGSIGSELARQIASLPPKELILMGRGENSIYEIEQELIGAFNFRSTSVICDVRNKPAVDRLLEEKKPSVVFHAAAHKHVPLMQSNPIEAIQNNILGTLNLIDSAIENEVDRFILVSTDKAVNPTSVMGASKRVCELLVGAAAHENVRTRFATVRFGNVLGSRGSLVPLLTAQIKRGGPVSITHPDMTRYFMTIPEAAQLIVQAGAMGYEGDIFILDMGEPVRIQELVYDLISLHGLVPEQDIEIKVIGMRPGEKLYEELKVEGQHLESTANPKIGRLKGIPLDLEVLRREVAELEELCNMNRAEEARVRLMDLAYRYTPISNVAVVHSDVNEFSSDRAANP